MKTLSTRQFLLDFPKLARAGDPIVVTQFGKRIGTYTPDNAEPPEVDIQARLDSYCTAPLPVTGAELLKAGKKR